jgi:hypothetical protein
MSKNKIPSFNEWFLSLPEGQQKVLREDKWMLAEAAYQAGRKFAEDAKADVEAEAVG